MILSTSPRKVVPLSTGDDWEPVSKSKSGSITKRVFFCGVVVESENGREISEDVQELVASLGEPLGSYSEGDDGMVSQSEALNGDRSDTDARTRRRALTDSSAIQDIINELVSTERSYVKRLRVLKYDYADPLRTFARSKDTAIVPAYEAKTLFGNVDNLVPVNEAFLADLEKMVAPDGPHTVGYIGDVALRHFKDIRGFDQYKQYYNKREEAQAIFEREMSKKSSGFAAFVDRIKYSSADTRNRVGLRELLMDPVQRIPRYTLLFRTMIKRMAPNDPQRAKLIEADEIASKIALAETDEETKRASVMYCLGATVDGFPPGLISNSRRFIDCVDVEDVPVDSIPSASSSASFLDSLHCTLFLFDDKLMIVKRPGNGDKSGRVLSGLDQVEKVTKGGGLPSGLKKSGMSCKGVFDISDVVATDVGGPDVHLYLETPPQDQTERWSGRPFRCLSVVFPPAPPNFNPQRTETEKTRFLENLWHAQATIRARSGNSVVLRAEEREVESRGGRTTYARTYFNVYQRTAFLREAKKTKVVVQIDSLGTSDPIPFGVNGPPFVSIRVQPMAGELSRYKVTSSDPNDEQEEDIVQTSRVSDRIVHTIHQYGLFKFRTGKNSVPSTPTATTRSRAAIFGLDAISRNLFNALPGSSKGDIFGSSINSARRSKSSVTRSSIYTQSTSDGSMMRFSHRSGSTMTGATSMSSMEDGSFSGSRSSSRSRKLLKRRSKSPGSEPDSASPKRGHSRSRTVSREPSPAPMDADDVDGPIPPPTVSMDQSEWDLTLRLELARRNSQNQHGKSAAPPVSSWQEPVEETIYEETPPQALRPSSRASRDTYSQRSTTPTYRPPSTTPTREPDSPEYHERPLSRASSGGPRGPRSPSPLPPTPRAQQHFVSPGVDIDSAMETTLVDIGHRLTTPGKPVSPLPRSRRQPFEPTGNMEGVPKAVVNGVQKAPSTVEPLSIKKKTSVRSSEESPSAGRKAYSKTSPLARGRIVSPRRVSPLIRHTKAPTASGSSTRDVDGAKLLRFAEVAREEVESSRRAVKRIKLDTAQLRAGLSPMTDDDDAPPRTPRGLPQRAQTSNTTPMTKAAQERLDEMRQLIGKRAGEGTPRARARSFAEPSADDALRLIEEAATDADRALLRAAAAQDALGADLARLAADLSEKGALLDRARAELQSTRRQCELVKSLLADATAENEIMYEAFNEELDGMYNDAHLPADGAWAAMAQDLRRSKEARNALTRENSCVLPTSLPRADLTFFSIPAP
ncbi:hypothetical protein BV25DRAFT_1821601 [Artomyces pyxidatus]|uniref:Uncharacterized protein n=1 Tax=Artomyces pyxidatus TaxID=48021 RepID=A0ACB8TC52_9AGAM|nr:hypothetical protein BV25DRAFT_1821601 [Artomyces pyxidatus]